MVAGKMKKRKWIYCQHPVCYDIRCDLCNGKNITWSEFCGMVWCFKCKKDTPGTGGIFDGPIPLEVSKILGVSFDRINLKTKKLMKMNITKKADKIRWVQER